MSFREMLSVSQLLDELVRESLVLPGEDQMAEADNGRLQVIPAACGDGRGFRDVGIQILRITLDDVGVDLVRLSGEIHLSVEHIVDICHADDGSHDVGVAVALEVKHIGGGALFAAVHRGTGVFRNIVPHAEGHGNPGLHHGREAVLPVEQRPVRSEDQAFAVDPPRSRLHGGGITGDLPLVDGAVDRVAGVEDGLGFFGGDDGDFSIDLVHDAFSLYLSVVMCSEGVDNADVFVAGGPNAGVLAVLVAFQRGFVDPLGQIEDFTGELPHAGGERLVLFHGDDVNGDGDAGHNSDDGPVKRQLEDVSVAAAVGLEPLQAVASLEIDQTVFRTEPVHPDLTGNGTILCPNHTFRDAVRQQFRRERVQPDAALQFQEKAEVLSGNDFALLSRRPFRKCLGGSAVGFASPGIYGTVRNHIVTVKCLAAFEDQAVGSSTDGFMGPSETT